MPRTVDEIRLANSRNVNEWRKKTSVAFTIKLNKATQMDVIEKLQATNNKTQYIVDLIRKDLNK